MKEIRVVKTEKKIKCYEGRGNEHGHLVIGDQGKLAVLHPLMWSGST
jgi:hypothetical protein